MVGAVDVYDHLLQSEFSVAGGARETSDTPGFVESRHHCRDEKRIICIQGHFQTSYVEYEKHMNMGFIVMILTITFNHTVAVIAHITKELEKRKIRIESY